MRVMGQDPMRTSEFREYLRVVRALLDGQAVDYEYRGKTREIKFLHLDRHFINLQPRIPIYAAANGPKALEATGAYADGWITVGGQPEVTSHKLDKIRQGRRTPDANCRPTSIPLSSPPDAYCARAKSSPTTA